MVAIKVADTKIELRIRISNQLLCIDVDVVANALDSCLA